MNATVPLDAISAVMTARSSIAAAGSCSTRNPVAEEPADCRHRKPSIFPSFTRMTVSYRERDTVLASIASRDSVADRAASSTDVLSTSTESTRCIPYFVISVETMRFAIERRPDRVRVAVHGESRQGQLAATDGCPRFHPWSLVSPTGAGRVAWNNVAADRYAADQQRDAEHDQRQRLHRSTDLLDGGPLGAPPAHRPSPSRRPRRWSPGLASAAASSLAASTVATAWAVVPRAAASAVARPPRLRVLDGVSVRAGRRCALARLPGSGFATGASASGGRTSSGPVISATPRRQAPTPRPRRRMPPLSAASWLGTRGVCTDCRVDQLDATACVATRQASWSSAPELSTTWAA